MRCSNERSIHYLLVQSLLRINPRCSTSRLSSAETTMRFARRVSTSPQCKHSMLDAPRDEARAPVQSLTRADSPHCITSTCVRACVCLNCFIAPLLQNWRGKVTDFGMSREFSSQDVTMTQCGSPLWMSPEMIRNDPYTEKADVYCQSLVCLVCFCVMHTSRAHNESPCNDAHSGAS